MRVGMWIFALIVLLIASAVKAEITFWKLGGSGLEWSANDTTRLFIDFTSVPRAIQPIYLTPEETVFSHLEQWAHWRTPDDRILEFVEGEMPRMWRWRDGLPAPNGSLLIDGDRTTYYSTKAVPLERGMYTFDFAVPVPAVSFGFATPSQGIRADGGILETDAVPGYDVSIAVEQGEQIIEGTLDPIDKLISDVNENFESIVSIEIPRQYVRFLRYRRQPSLLDQDYFASFTGGQFRQAPPGTIGEFEFYALGVPRQVLYKSKITSLGASLNFGRLFWKATPMRMEKGVPVEAPDADVRVSVEVRTGRDDDPAVYHGFLETGFERVVTRDYYENTLRTRYIRPNLESPMVLMQPKPDMRASIDYDAKNWTFWSVPFTASGQPLNLRSGSFLQLRIALESEDFDAFVRLDSLWIETAPLLAREVTGELARQDDLEEGRGFTEVTLGEETDFVYALQADFTGLDALGFDVLRIRTGNRTRFRGLEMGNPLVSVVPERVIEEEGGLLVYLPQRITRLDNPPMRVRFTSSLFDFATTFEGEVLDSQREVLPQPVVSGDVSEELATNSLRVLGTPEDEPDFIQQLVLSVRVFTPNDDGINEEVEVEYLLFRLPVPVPVTLNIYSLDGRLMARIDGGVQDSGPQKIIWNGRDELGRLLPPGIYLASVELNAEFSTAPGIHPVGLVY